MAGRLRDGIGAALVLFALGVLFSAVVQLSARDYLASSVLVLTGLSVMRAGVELLRAEGE
ncbi:MAG: hypothetical protein OXU20_11605 [Myxococcales bacterium]|nr:hypothetical protein [Myxococcales bacterium]MDD9971767.1 hypothetical protein [Myxococcales bacterium]